jgi:hypothetical protein
MHYGAWSPLLVYYPTSVLAYWDAQGRPTGTVQVGYQVRYSIGTVGYLLSVTAIMCHPSHVPVASRRTNFLHKADTLVFALPHMLSMEPVVS